MKYNFLEATCSNLSNCPGTFDFEGSDSREFWNENFKTKRMPQTQLNRTVRYTLNSHGYRCPEFDTIDWQNTIVTLGCSHTFGISIDDNETYASLLQEKLGIPVVNLGISATDIWFQVYNAIELMKLNVQGVILQVPNKERFTVFGTGNKAKNFGTWNMQTYAQLVELWADERNLEQWHLFGCDYIEKILGDKLLYSFSFLDTDHLPTMKIISQDDVGRDNAHPGPMTHKKIAEIIAKESKL